MSETTSETAAPEQPEAPPQAVAAPREPAPQPLGVPRTPTGNADVDAALERLADTDELPTDGHVEVYEDAHRQIRAALEALDERPGPPAPVAGAYRG
ncbi:hypothetical protein SRB5_32820 [Streptomyces sp. RB5]|uniref:Uncharacterized protein n=1 Tax=Streptomyces smaragdinus TaxID=2585196 RepID=A0A7K0CI35_9ACTN|nr:hypothetical protein [Streptomyces smaragdinus]MQY13139.1 hypothetical protein [Streptomyces smaragdinus]